MLAEAGIQDTSLHRWIPASSGMTNREIVLVQDLHKFAREMVINTPANEVAKFDKRTGIVRTDSEKI